MNDLLIGLRGFSRSFSFALRNGLWWMFLAPVLLWLLFAGGIVWASAGVVDLVTGWLSAWDIAVPADGRTGLEGLWDDIKNFFVSAREVIVLVVVKLALWFLFGLVGKYIVLILLSPLLAYASECTEEILAGRVYPFRTGQFLKDVGRGMLMALRNGGLELLINALLWTLTLFVAVLAAARVVLLRLQHVRLPVRTAPHGHPCQRTSGMGPAGAGARQRHALQPPYEPALPQLDHRPAALGALLQYGARGGEHRRGAGAARGRGRRHRRSEQTVIALPLIHRHTGPPGSNATGRMRW